jgi:sulfide:quinone oxidoreductase
VAHIVELTPSISVGPQIQEADLAAIKAHGFKAVICNRPDGESYGQPASAALADAAERNGLEFRYIPVVSGRLTEADVAAFAEALAEFDGPVLAFCRSGARSTVLWALASAPNEAADFLIATARKAGCDLAPMRPQLEARRAAGASAGRTAQAC